MRPKSSTPDTPSERLVRDIRRATRKQYSAAPYRGTDLVHWPKRGD